MKALVPAFIHINNDLSRGMLNGSGLLYLSARAVSAAGNLLAVAIFSRMAGPAEYGHYVLIFAWSLIVYGFGAQWMRFAYFGVYQSERFGEYVGSLAALLCGGVTVVALVLATLGIFGFFEPEFLVAVFALVCGITLYEAAFEVARTMLSVRGAALSMILRALLTVAFGSLSLWLGGGARGLAIAIALAHVLAAAPALATFSGLRWARGSRAASLHIIGYGWPLLLSFGVTAVGQSIDRLLLAHYLGTAALGPYGVVADMLRQSFMVLGETISLSMVTVAKSHANNGDFEATTATLRRAFNACLATATFGAAFFIVFGDVLLRLVLNPDFVAPVHGLIPIFAIAFAFTTMRNFYFAQVIYFTHASYLDLMVSFLFVVVSAALSLVLVPAYGAHGAAIALMVASITSCFAFMVLGRGWYKLPIDFTALGVMPALAILFVFGARTTAELISNGSVSLVLDGLVFAVFGGFAIRRFGLLTATPAVGDAVTVR
jgi:O-antigen/teichoic acid export membrane protein